MQLRRIFASTLFFGLLLPLAAAVPVLGAPPPQPDCMILTVGVPDPGNPPMEPRMVKVTFTNNCGKDVTAVGFRFEGPGVEPWNDNADAVMALAVAPDVYYSEEPGGPPIHPDIFRAGQSRFHRQPVRGDAPFYTAAVTCVLFLDHTSVGDPAAIAAILRARRAIWLPVAEENLAILSKLQAMDYKEARSQLLEGRIKAKRTNAPFLGELRLFSTEDEASWRARVQRMLDHEKRLVQVLTEHSAADEKGK
jgi:hypothetical protein